MALDNTFARVPGEGLLISRDPLPGPDEAGARQGMATAPGIKNSTPETDGDVGHPVRTNEDVEERKRIHVQQRKNGEHNPTTACRDLKENTMLVLEESVRRLAATRYGAEHAIHGKSRHRPRLMLNACRA